MAKKVVDEMNETVNKILEQDKSQKWFFIITGTIFGALAAYLFLFNKAIPDQLQTMWLTVCGFIAAGWAKGINKAEQVLNKDIDGDGDIGIDNTITETTQAAQTVQTPVQIAAAPVQEVSYLDAESDPSTYNIQGYIN